MRNQRKCLTESSLMFIVLDRVITTFSTRKRMALPARFGAI